MIWLEKAVELSPEERSILLDKMIQSYGVRKNIEGKLQDKVKSGIENLIRLHDSYKLEDYSEFSRRYF
jgi:hypothetical protein